MQRQLDRDLDTGFGLRCLRDRRAACCLRLGQAGGHRSADKQQCDRKQEHSGKQFFILQNTNTPFKRFRVSQYAPE